MILQSEERVLFIINDNTVRGVTRLQQYGFLLHKQYRKQLSRLAIEYMVPFYDDWKPHYYGPHSRNLEEDIGRCINVGLIKRYDPDDGRHEDQLYSPTARGLSRWFQILTEKTGEIIDINERIRLLQAKNPRDLLMEIYNTYPEYIVTSKTEDGIVSH